ncbi:hypothetical protein BDV93DRAFT_523933 [Ceratobasidium sp. AG-I]|nr:hypothetical protein BDV93DRAFT_523933 [Ceratobasidium sp. AG-I]
MAPRKPTAGTSKKTSAASKKAGTSKSGKPKTDKPSKSRKGKIIEEVAEYDEKDGDEEDELETPPPPPPKGTSKETTTRPTPDPEPDSSTSGSGADDSSNEGGGASDGSAVSKNKKKRKKRRSQASGSMSQSDVEMENASDTPATKGDAPAKKKRKKKPKNQVGQASEGTQPVASNSTGDAGDSGGGKGKGKSRAVQIEEEDDPDAPIKTLEEGMNEWQAESVRTLRAQVFGLRENAAVLAEVEAARIGGGFISACGIGSLHGVAGVGPNPNGRANPRPLEESHVKALYDILKVLGGKRDSESPIYIVISRKLLTDECLALMPGADARNAAHVMPRVELKRPHGVREDILENRLWLRWDNNGWIPLEELARDATELAELRNNRPLALLLNGNHRIAALLLLAADICSERDRLLDALRSGVLEHEDCQESLKKLTDAALGLTWRVIVYDADKLSSAGRNYLVQNEQQLPAMDAGAGEKGWWLSEHLSIMMQAAMDSGRAKNREEAINIAQRSWREELGKNMTVGEDEDDVTKGRGRQKGEMVGQDGVSRLFTEPTTMEMVFDCRAALWAFGNTLSKVNASKMLRPSGAPLASHFWLALRTLIKLCNVAGGDDLVGAERYLATAKEITAEGDLESVVFWLALHVRHETTPQLLSLYGEKEAKKFDALFEKACKTIRHEDSGIRYDDSETIMILRELFDEFGAYMLKSEDELVRKLSASIRLYARLPLASLGASSASFFPAALLPSIKWMNAKSAKWNGDWKLTREAVAVIEALMKPYQLVWTMGAQGTSKSCNWNNWYRRSTGLHQLLLACYEATETGCIEARLSEAIYIFEDLRFPHALFHANLSQESTLNSLILDGCARKSGTFNYPLLSQDVLDSLRSRIGRIKAEDLEETVLRARKALKNFVYKPGYKLTLTQIRANHPILNAIDDAFWTHIDVRSWLEGWHDKSDKRIKSAGALIGWGLVTSNYRKEILKPAMRNQYARWLFAVVARVLLLQGEDPWWQEHFELENMPEPLEKIPDVLTQPPPDKKSTKASAAASKASGSGAKPETERTTRSKTSAAKSTQQSEPAKSQDGAKASAKRKKKDGGTAVETTSKGKRPAPRSNSIINSSGDEEEGRGGSGGKKLDIEAGEGADDEEADEEGEDGEGEDGEADDGEAEDESEDEEAKEMSRAQKGKGVDKSERVKPEFSIADSTIPFASQFAEEDENPAHVRTQIPQGHLTMRSILDNANPGYIFTPNVMSNKTLHGIYGQELSSRMQLPANNRLDTDMLHRLTAIMGYGRLLWIAISKERQKFRTTLMAFARTAVDTPYGSDLAATWIVPSIAHLRDLYIVRLSAHFMVHAKMSREEGINEAYALANADGMFDCDFFEIDKKTNQVTVNLETTFPYWIQGSVAECVNIPLGTAPGTEISRMNTLQSLHYMPIARGHGRTEAESLQNGVNAIANAAYFMKESPRHPNSTIHLAPPTRPRSPILHFTYPAACRELCDGQTDESVKSRWLQSPDIQTTVEGSTVALSTGVFLGKDIQDCVARHGQNDSKYISLKQKVSLVETVVRTDWEESQQFDRNDYLTWLKASGYARPPTQDYETSTQNRSKDRSSPAWHLAPSAQVPRPSSPASSFVVLRGSPQQLIKDTEPTVKKKPRDRPSSPRNTEPRVNEAKVLVPETQKTATTLLDTPRPEPTPDTEVAASSQSLGGDNGSEDTSGAPDTYKDLWESTQNAGEMANVAASLSDGESIRSAFQRSRPGSPNAPDTGEEPVASKRRRSSTNDEESAAKRQALGPESNEPTSTPVESEASRAKLTEVPGAPSRPRTGLGSKPLRPL